MRFLFVLTLLLVPCHGMADIIVLKSGKRFEINGSYEEKGQMALFKDNNGELIQLPLSVIDISKSQQATEAQKAKLVEEASAPPKPSFPLTDIQKVADSIEEKEGDENRQTRTITNDNLGKYDHLTYPTDLPGDAKPTQGPRGSKPTTKNDYDSMKSVTKEHLPALIQKMREAEETLAKIDQLIAYLETQLASADHASRRKLKQTLETLRNDRQRLQTWLAKARSTARMAGQFVD